MKATANLIRAELKALGLQAVVRCRPGYKIHVETQDKDAVLPVVLRTYHSQPHHWLTVRVNQTWLPMPPVTRA